MVGTKPVVDMRGHGQPQLLIILEKIKLKLEVDTTVQSRRCMQVARSQKVRVIWLTLKDRQTH